MPTCSAYGCTNSSRHKNNRLNGIFFHDFPKRDRSPERFEKWVEYCNRKDFDPGTNRKSACLCSRHFEVSDLDESQLLKIKMMPSANLRGPRLKPGTVPTVILDSVTDVRKSSKVPQNPIKKKKTKPVTIPEIDWDELTSKKRRFTTSLMKWRDCLIKEEKPEQKRTSLPGTVPQCQAIKNTKHHKAIQCELGLEMQRYAGTPCHKSTSLKLFLSDNYGYTQEKNISAENDKKAPLKSLEDNALNEDDRKTKNEALSDDSSGVSDNENETVIDESNFAAWGSLLLLFKICNICSQEVTNIHHGMKGNKIYVKSLCPCGNKVTWTSRPT